MEKHPIQGGYTQQCTKLLLATGTLQLDHITLYPNHMFFFAYNLSSSHFSTTGSVSLSLVLTNYLSCSRKWFSVVKSRALSSNEQPCSSDHQDFSH